MTPSASTRSTRRQVGRLAAVYAGVLLVGAVTVAVSLSVGRDLDAAPELAEATEVGGLATRCLGSQLTAIQSGVHLDVHAPGATGIDGPVGARLLRGTVDADGGAATLRGHCRAGTALAGQAVVARIVVGEPGARGVVEVAGERLGVTMRESDVGSAPAATGGNPPLSGTDLVARTFLAVAAILVVARLVGLLFALVRLTRVMGEIVAGILLGPSLLGAVAPSATDYLFPASVTGILEVVGQFGLIFFMFLVGLELNRRLLVGLGHQVVLLSHVSIVMPFATGVGLALLLYPRLGNGDFSGFALFMGAAMAITAFPVLARILTDTGLNRTPIGALAITCAAVDDLTAWCLLAAVIAVVESSGPGDLLTTLALTFGFVGFMGIVVRPVLGRITARLGGRGKLGPGLVPAVLIGLLLSSWATEMIGIHAIFGAFVLGVVLPRNLAARADLRTRLEDVTLVFLLPVFFAVVGLSTRVSLLDSAELWLFTGAVIAAAIAGKLGGSLLGARVAGYGWRQSTALGLLMNTRGLTEIVILTIGQSLGVISPALFAIMVLMALATTLMATPLLSVVYPADRIARESEPLPDPRERRGPRRDRSARDHRAGDPPGQPEEEQLTTGAVP